MATIDYMIASYGPFSASATGGNALARDLLAGVAALYATPCKFFHCIFSVIFTDPVRAVYENIGGKYHLEWPTTILGCLAFLITIPIYIFYWKGPAIRKRSKFAQILASDRAARGEGRVPGEKKPPKAGHLEANP